MSLSLRAKRSITYDGDWAFLFQRGEHIKTTFFTKNTWQINKNRRLRLENDAIFKEAFDYIAKIRCFITFISYISFYLIRFRGFKQKNRRLQGMVLPMPESTFALYSADSARQRTPLALSWPILFFGNCRSIMRVRTFGRVSAELWTRGNGGCPPLAAGWPGGAP